MTGRSPTGLAVLGVMLAACTGASESTPQPEPILVETQTPWVLTSTPGLTNRPTAEPPGWPAPTEVSPAQGLPPDMALTATVLENWGAPTQPPAPIGATSADLAARFIAAGLARGVDGHVLPSDDGTVPFGCTGTEFHAAGTESPFPNGVVFRCPAKVDAMMLTANYASLSEIAPSWVFRSPDGLTVLRLDGTLPTEQALQFEAEVHPGAAAEPEAAAPWGGTPAALAARFVAAGLARKAHGGAVATADEADGLPLGCAGTVLELVDPVEDGLVVQCSKKTDADMLATRFAAESEQPRHGAWWVFRSSDGLIVLLLDGALPEERARKFGAEIQ